MIVIKPDMSGLQHMIDMSVKQVQFAAARAVTALAREVRDKQVENEKKVLDRPRPFTTEAIRAIGAVGRTPVAKVVMLDRTAAYLAPYEFGGLNMLNGRALLKPIARGELLDRYGNIPAGTLAKARTRADFFFGTVKTKNGPVSGLWQRAYAPGTMIRVSRAPAVKKRVMTVDKKGRVHFKMKKTGDYGPVKTSYTAKGVLTKGRLRLWVRFTDAHPVRQRLNWFAVAEKLVEDRSARVFSDKIIEAFKKAKA